MVELVADRNILAGQRMHPVLQLIKDRALKKSKPGHRSDGFKLGAVVEGGAMRGVVTAAQLLTFRKLGLLPTIDIFYGESIGGPNAAWALSGDLGGAINLYFNDVNNHHFIDMRRVLFRRPVVDINFLEDVAMRKYPIHLDALQGSGAELKLLATQVNGNLDYPLISLSGFKDFNDFLQAVRGSINMPPPLGTAPTEFKGESLWDAGIVDLLPVKQAIRDDCTHILVFSSVPEHYQAKQYPWIARVLVSRGIGRYNPRLVGYFNNSRLGYNQTLKELMEKQQGQNGSPWVFTCGMPAQSKVLHSFEKDVTVLKSAAKIAENFTYQVLTRAGLNAL